MRTLPPKICFIANPHSVHVRSFLKYFVNLYARVWLISPVKCLFEIPGVTIIQATNYTRFDSIRRHARNLQLLRKTQIIYRSLRSEIQHRIASDVTISRAAKMAVDLSRRVETDEWDKAIEPTIRLARNAIRMIKPDIVQALRLYPEGIIASAINHPKKILFVWGSDLSGYASWNSGIGDQARVALNNCTALLHDNDKDYRFAGLFGFSDKKPHLKVPSNGGIATDENISINWAVRHTKEASYATIRRIGNSFMDNEPILRAMQIIKNNHGIRAGYTMHSYKFGVYYDLYRILARNLGIWEQLHFKPPYALPQVFDALSSCRLQVSPAIDDGCSNALLETMWAGAIPIYSNCESIREWIEDGTNGYLFEMNDPKQIASQFLRAYEERPLHNKFANKNREMVREHADYKKCMAQVQHFYSEL